MGIPEGQKPLLVALVSLTAPKMIGRPAFGFSSARIRALADTRTRQVDLLERTVIPGINDAHCHLIPICNQTGRMPVEMQRDRRGCAALSMPFDSPSVSASRRRVRSSWGGNPPGALTPRPIAVQLNTPVGLDPIVKARSEVFAVRRLRDGMSLTNALARAGGKYDTTAIRAVYQKVAPGVADDAAPALRRRRLRSSGRIRWDVSRKG